MFIIVEGPDLAGKTTLIERIRQRLCLDSEVELLHKSQPQEITRRWVLNDYVLQYEGYVPASPVSILSDRWHYGEATHSGLYRPDTNIDGFGLLGVSGWRWVELFLMSRGAVIVRLDASDDTLRERLALRGDEHVKNDTDLLRIATNYRLVHEYSPTTQLDFNTTVDAEPDIDTIWFKALQDEAAAETVLNITPEYIGNLLPDVLLVGDKRNVTQKYGNETTLPFMPVDQSSGIFLLDSLPEDFWRRIGMVNGNDMTGDLRELWETLGRPRPVALGNAAADALKTAGFDEVEFSWIRHPAHARRFNRDKQAEYGLSIVEAAELKGTYA